MAITVGGWPGLFFLLPIGFFRYPVFVTHSHRLKILKGPSSSTWTSTIAAFVWQVIVWKCIAGCTHHIDPQGRQMGLGRNFLQSPNDLQREQIANKSASTQSIVHKKNTQNVEKSIIHISRSQPIIPSKETIPFSFLTSHLFWPNGFSTAWGSYVGMVISFTSARRPASKTSAAQVTRRVLKRSRACCSGRPRVALFIFFFFFAKVGGVGVFACFVLFKSSRTAFSNAVIFVVWGQF